MTDETSSKQTVRERIEAATEMMMHGARVNFEMVGALVPAAFVFDNDGEPHMLTAIFDKPKDKDAFAAEIRRVCAGNHAVAILVIAEMWAAGAADDPTVGNRAQAWLAEHGTLEHFPGRREAILASLETAAGREEWAAIIERDENDKPSLGPWAKLRVSKSDGRLVGLLHHLN